MRIAPPDQVAVAAAGGSTPTVKMEGAGGGCKTEGESIVDEKDRFREMVMKGGRNKRTILSRKSLRKICFSFDCCNRCAACDGGKFGW